MKKVLLPIDFSPNSRNAVSYALNFMKNEPCEFIFLHCYGNKGHFYYPEESCTKETSFENIQSTAEKRTHSFLQEVRISYPNSNYNYTIRIENSSLLLSINKHIEEDNLYCIVIGTHGITNKTETAYGNNSRILIEEVKNCPLFVIPPLVKFNPIKEIVLPTSFDFEPKFPEFEFLKNLVTKTKASLIILHVQTSEKLSPIRERNSDLVNKFLKEEKPDFHYLQKVSIAAGIYCFTESRKSDLVVFINKKESFLNNLMIEDPENIGGNYFKMPLVFLQYSSVEN